MAHLLLNVVSVHFRFAAQKGERMKGTAAVKKFALIPLVFLVFLVILAVVGPPEKHEKKSLKQAEGASQNTFHCKTPDCAGKSYAVLILSIFCKT